MIDDHALVGISGQPRYLTDFCERFRIDDGKHMCLVV